MGRVRTREATAVAVAQDQMLYELASGSGRGRLLLGRAFRRFVERGGPGAFGLSSRDAYCKERLSRTGGWVGEAALLAERLERLPRIAAAYDAGKLRWSMVELLARRASTEDEEELLGCALVPGVTVHTMREVLASDDAEEAFASARCMLEETLPSEEWLIVEATKIVHEHVNGPGADWFAAVVGETASTMPDLIYADAPVDLDAVRARVAEGIARRREEEERAEPDLPANEPERGDFPEEPLPDDVRALDALMRRISMRLASRDLLLGRIASEFFRAARWRELGYASDTQYCRERLGMSRTAVWNRITFARRCEPLPKLGEAVSTMAVGFEAAKEITRIATPRTEEAWVERAQRRTFKHLREEVRMVETHARLTGRREEPWPPSDEEMADQESFERRVLSGAPFGAEEPEEPDASPEIRIEGEEAVERESAEPELAEAEPASSQSRSPAAPDAIGDLANRLFAAIRAGRTRRKGEVKHRWSADREDAHLYRTGRERHRQLGRPNAFLTVMCLTALESWVHELRQERCKYDHIHQRDRFRCASPGCFRRLCTLHHILRRMLGGDDRWTNLLTLCDVCHLQNIHERGSLQVFGEAPDGLTFVFGERPVFVVRGREKRPAVGRPMCSRIVDVTSPRAR